MNCTWSALGAGPAPDSNGDFKFKYPNENDMRHFFNNPNHNFNGKDPKNIIEKIIKILEEAFKGGKLKDNYAQLLIL